jgi:hypothetical protein
MHTPQGEVRFHTDKQGLPFINLNKSDEDAAILLVVLVEAQREEKNNEEHTREGTALVQMVRGNYVGFTKGEVLQAQVARQAQAMLGNPSEKHFQEMVWGNLILNCPIACQDISKARQIFGPDLASACGKTVRRAPARVVGDYVAVPRQLVKANAAVALAVDVFFVDGTAFLMTVLRRIKFVMAEHVPVRMATSLSKHLCQVLLLYGHAGFRVRNILMDGEFEKIKELMPPVECNTMAVREHVSKAERCICTIKEHVRGLVTMLPFTYIS